MSAAACICERCDTSEPWGDLSGDPFWMTEWRLLSSSIRMLDILAAHTRLFLLSVLCILCKYEKYTFIVGSGCQVAVSVLTLIPPWYRIIRPETGVSKIYFVDILSCTHLLWCSISAAACLLVMVLMARLEAGLVAAQTML